jgi:hypothetical protein
VVSPTLNHQAGEPPLVGCPRLLIQYIRSYPPYLEAVISIHNLRTSHAVVTRDPPNMVYSDDVNLLGANIKTIKKNTETLIDASKEIGLEVNTGKTKHMLLSRHQNPGQNHDIKKANRCFKNVAQYKYLGTTITYQNLIQKELKRRLNSNYVCYHSVNTFVFSPTV